MKLSKRLARQLFTGVTSVALMGSMFYVAQAQPGVTSGAVLGSPLGMATTMEEGAPPSLGTGGPFSLEGVDLSPRPPVLPRTPAEEAKLIQLQPGYSLTPVLTDPQIINPAQIAFDANGRMYVLELRTYMRDADAKDELTPRNRISRWEDKDGDGVYETGTVFVDNLIFPRFVTPLGDGQILAKESNSDDTWLYTDTNGDGKADKKELFVTGLGRSGNVEHQESGLTWALDNWMYSTYNATRVRWTPTGPKKEAVGPNNGAWGVTQDDYGKVWFQGGASGLPSYFQFPVLYGNVATPDPLMPGFRTPWGAPIGTGDMQGGTSWVRAEGGTLNAATAGAGANIYRGDRLPAELKGDYFYGEVVARVFRRTKAVDDGGLTRVANPYQAQKSEFIRSMDPLFRPVDNKTAPDGTIYIADMYHGIIQEAQWTQPGSYLRAKIQQYKLDAVTDHGRIWRLTYKGMPRDTTKPRMYQETSAQLVGHLTHPNGWWRDTAQQQLVLRQDKSVVPALRTMARSNANKLARIHAAWTLEGLNSLDAATVRTFFKDSDPNLRAQGARLSEVLYKGGDASFGDDLKALAKDPDNKVAIQALLSLQYLKHPDAVAVAKQAMATRQTKGIQLIADRIISPPASVVGLGDGGGDNPPLRSAAEIAVLERGAQIFQESCGECHGHDGQGAPDGAGGLMAPALAGNPRVAQGSPEHVLRVLMSGLTDPIEGHTYAAGAMVPQRAENDDWIAAVASYLRNGMANGATLVTPDMVAYIRAQEASRTQPYTDAELKRVQARLLPADTTWKVTASHNAPVVIGGTAHPEAAMTLEGWTTGLAQAPGMWFQIELPRTVNLTGIDYQALIGAAPRPPGAPALPPGQRPPRLAFAPRAYKLEVSTDGQSWRTVREGQGSSMYNSLIFAPVPARFVRITTTAPASDNAPWGMRYLKLFEKP